MVPTDRSCDAVYLDGEEVEGIVRRSLHIDPEDRLPPAIFVTFLHQNKVPLLSLALPENISLSGNVWMFDEWRTAIVRERAIYEGARSEYAQLVQAWRMAEIDCICFKSAGIAPSFPYSSSNADILVRARDIDAARTVLLGLGYVELRNAEEPHKWLFRRFHGGRSVSAVHLHAQVGWEEGFMLEADLWQRSSLSPDDSLVRIPGREDVIAINLAHGLIENKALDLSDLQKIRFALRSGPIDWVYMDQVASERGWLPCLHFGLLLTAHLEHYLYGDTSIPEERLQECERTMRSVPWLEQYWHEARGRELTLPFKISFAVSKRLFFSKVWKDKHLALASRPTNTLLFLARGFKQKSGIRPQSPMLFTLSGVDGSGKTVQIAELRQAFSTCAIRSTQLWTRFGSTPGLQLLHRARHVLHTRSASNGTALAQKGSEGYGPYVRRGPALIIWITLAMVDYLIRLQYVRWRLAGGDVVLVDRYVDDAEVELQQRLPRYQRLAAFLAALLRVAAPRASIAYWIDIDAETSLQRRAAIPGEVDRSNTCERYAAVARSRAMHRIDGNLPLDVAAGQIVHRALSVYLGSFRPMGNIVFFDNDWQLNPPRPWMARLTTRFSCDRTRTSSVEDRIHWD